VPEALRRAVRRVNQTLAELKVEPHPDKTFIGRAMFTKPLQIV
jgi:hypothetical protein